MSIWLSTGALNADVIRYLRSEGHGKNQLYVDEVLDAGYKLWTGATKGEGVILAKDFAQEDLSPKAWQMSKVVEDAISATKKVSDLLMRRSDCWSCHG